MSGLPFLAIWLGKFHNLLIMHVFWVVWCSAFATTRDVAENSFDKDVETISRIIHKMSDFTVSVRIVLHSTKPFCYQKSSHEERRRSNFTDATKCKNARVQPCLQQKASGLPKSNRFIGLAIFCTFFLLFVFHFWTALKLVQVFACFQLFNTKCLAICCQASRTTLMNYSIWGFFSHYYQSVPIFHNPAEAIKTTFSNEFLTQSRVNLHNFLTFRSTL